MKGASTGPSAAILSSGWLALKSKFLSFSIQFLPNCQPYLFLHIGLLYIYTGPQLLSLPDSISLRKTADDSKVDGPLNLNLRKVYFDSFGGWGGLSRRRLINIGDPEKPDGLFCQGSVTLFLSAESMGQRTKLSKQPLWNFNPSGHTSPLRQPHSTIGARVLKTDKANPFAALTTLARSHSKTRI